MMIEVTSSALRAAAVQRPGPPGNVPLREVERAGLRPALAGGQGPRPAEAGGQDLSVALPAASLGEAGQAALLASAAVEGDGQAPALAARQDDGAVTGAVTGAGADEGRGPDGLTEAEQALVKELAARDREVRAHEQAHAAVGGPYAGSPSYTYQTGPDGRRYAIGGSVPIDVSPVRGDPEATIEKMEVVKAAALAPAEPSSADRRIASLAEAQRLQAMAELTALRVAERTGEGDASGAAAPAQGPLSPLAAASQQSPFAAVPQLSPLAAVSDLLGRDPGADQGQAFDRAA